MTTIPWDFEYSINNAFVEKVRRLRHFEIPNPMPYSKLETLVFDLTTKYMRTNARVNCWHWDNEKLGRFLGLTREAVIKCPQNWTKDGVCELLFDACFVSTYELAVEHYQMKGNLKKGHLFFAYFPVKSFIRTDLGPRTERFIRMKYSLTLRT